MKIIIILLLSIHCSAVALCQRITITVNHLNGTQATLSSLEGEKLSQIDSIRSIDNNTFTFSIKSGNNHPGFYRLAFDKNKWIDFLNDGEDVSLSTDADNVSDSLNVLASESNRLYYSFIRLNKQYKAKSELLQLVLSRYPKNDPYYRTTQTAAAQLQKEYTNFITAVQKKMPASFVSRYILSGQMLMVDFNQPLNKQLTYFKTHALDKVDFDDPGLVCSDVFTSKSIEYMTYYRNPQLPKESLEKEFIVAVDTILNKAKVNHTVYQHIVEYLIDGFKKFGFDQPLDYIVENYVIKDDICLDVKTEGLIKKRIDQAKNFRIGNTVPNIVLPDIYGKEAVLHQIRADNLLIIFYSSTCPHCKTMLPRLSELYKGQKQKKVEVFAVALDDKKSDWLNFVKENNLNWINVSDVKGWDTKAAADYCIYATPTMILVDKEQKIIAKPLTIEELVNYF